MGNIQNLESMELTHTEKTEVSTTNYWTFTSHKTPNVRNQWVDIWLFAEDYTFDIISKSIQDSGFPMLIMQLAHILLQNKVWDKAAGLRKYQTGTATKCQLEAIMKK